MKKLGWSEPTKTLGGHSARSKVARCHKHSQGRAKGAMVPPNF